METKIKLDQELRNIAQQDREKQEPLNEVKMLLAGDAQEDLKIMRHLAGNSVLIQQEKEMSKIMDLEKHNTQYGQTFTLEQVKALAVKYNLRFLPSSGFKGKMDVEAISKLKQFAKDYNVSCTDEHSLSSRFMMLAPAESFHMDVKDLKGIRQAEREKIAREKDPILFYKIDANHLRMVHKWGTDLSWHRLLSGYYWKNFTNYCKVNMWACLLMLIPALLLMSSLLNKITYGKPDKDGFNGSTLVPIIGYAVVFLAMFITYRIRRSRVTSTEGKPYTAMFSETNWNTADFIQR